MDGGARTLAPTMSNLAIGSHEHDQRRKPAKPLAVRPFIKWAGGKRQLLPQLRRFVPTHFDQYFEPFLGSGALFFDLASRERIEGHPAWLTDVNRDLLGTYCEVAGHTEQVITALGEHE